MKKTLTLVAVLSSLLSGMACARDDIDQYDIQEVLNSTQATGVLNPDIQLFFGDQTHPAVKKTFSEVLTNKKTNAFGKSDKEACQWVFLSALKELQARAAREGHNAVIGITSYYKKRDFSSASKFECGAGAIMAGVALKGTVVTL